MHLQTVYGTFKDIPMLKRGIKQLQKWHAIPKEGQYLCRNGHQFRLREGCTADGWQWRCYSKIRKKKKKPKICRQRVSIRTNTVFEKSRLPICTILMFIFQWLNNIQLCNICRCAYMSIATAVKWNKICYDICSNFCDNNVFQLGGPGKVVEIDESKIERRKYYKGCYKEGQWFFGGVERNSTKCFILPVKNRSTETLLTIIKTYIREGTTIISDSWRAYSCLSQHGYVHFQVSQSALLKDPSTKHHMNTIVSLFNHAKKALPLYSRRKSYFKGYISKFLFLRWCRASKKDLMTEFFKAAHECGQTKASTLCGD